MSLIEMHVDAIAVDRKTGDPIVLLCDTENKLSLPIWIGAPEARAISLAVKNIRSKRPLTHDLLFSIISKFGYSIREIQITELQNEAYIASIVLTKENGNGHETTMSIDARPSDAIALSVLSGARVLVSSDLVNSESFALTVEAKQPVDEAFKQFLQQVKASDFKLDDPNDDTTNELEE